jgi:hypothetical protein
VAILHMKLLKIWQSSLGKFRQNLAKSQVRSTSLESSFYIFLATHWKPNVKTKCIFTFFLTFGNWNLLKLFHFSKFRFWQDLHQLKLGCLKPYTKTRLQWKFFKSNHFLQHDGRKQMSTLTLSCKTPT